MLSDARLYSACAAALLYAVGCVYFLWAAPRRQGASTRQANANSSLLIAYASQTGYAEQLARQTAQSLQAAGVLAHVQSLGHLDRADLSHIPQALFIVSTTGEGDAPDTASSFVHQMSSNEQPFAGLKYAVLALGDRSYANFCGFGRQLDNWLRHQGASALFDAVQVDNGDPAALRHWQHQLGTLTNRPDLPDWEAPRYDRWRLASRTQLNHGSAGDPCFHIELEPAGHVPSWTAGDILEVDPHNSTWEHPETPLPHREYSIASLREDGALHLLIREMRREDGSLGLGSGWLTRAPIGIEVAARTRINSNFHPPAEDRPLILIGNGTGIAGLRALLKARSAAGRRRNWLIFGERNRAHDAFYSKDIEDWQRQHILERTDLAFSRDQDQKRYVQHVLLENAERVREWVEQGAAIYVCGSLKGMAPAVHEALERILGRELLESLTSQGRYRRDVY